MRKTVPEGVSNGKVRRLRLAKWEGEPEGEPTEVIEVELNDAGEPTSIVRNGQEVRE